MVVACRSEFALRNALSKVLLAAALLPGFAHAAPAAAPAATAATPKPADGKAVDAKGAPADVAPANGAGGAADAATMAVSADPGEPGAGRLAPCPATLGGPGTPVPAISPALAATIRDRVHKRVGGAVTSVCRMPFGLYEVIVDAEVLYVDERVNYLLAGNAFDLRTQENLTAQRRDDTLRVDFKALPFQFAVKTVRGNGARVLAIFEDPNCPYCKRFEKDIATLSDTTIYTFLYPILSRDASVADDSYPKSKAIWCAPDRGAAWSQLMLEGKRLAPAPDSCLHPLDEVLALGQKLHITGTPTLIFSDGRRAPGAIPMARVEQMMAEAARTAAPKAQ
jgi:thiol:disulfide interchange protein DsbC